MGKSPFSKEDSIEIWKAASKYSGNIPWKRIYATFSQTIQDIGLEKTKRHLELLKKSQRSRSLLGIDDPSGITPSGIVNTLGVLANVASSAASSTNFVVPISHGSYQAPTPAVASQLPSAPSASVQSSMPLINDMSTVLMSMHSMQNSAFKLESEKSQLQSLNNDLQRRLTQANQQLVAKNSELVTLKTTTATHLQASTQALQEEHTHLEEAQRDATAALRERDAKETELQEERNRVVDLQNQLKEAKAQATEQQQVEELRTKLQKSEEMLKSTQQQLLTRSQELGQALSDAAAKETELQKLHQESEEHEKTLSLLRSEHDAKETALKDVRKDVIDLQEQLKDKTEATEQQQKTELQDLQAQFDTLKTTTDDQQRQSAQDLQAAQDKASTALSECEGKKTELEALQERFDALKEAKPQPNVPQQRLKEDITKKDKELQDLQVKYDNADRSLVLLRATVKRQNDRALQTDKELEKEKAEVSRLTTEVTRLTAEVSRMAAEMTTLQTKEQKNQDRIQELENVERDLKVALLVSKKEVSKLAEGKDKDRLRYADAGYLHHLLASIDKLSRKLMTELEGKQACYQFGYNLSMLWFYDVARCKLNDTQVSEAYDVWRDFALKFGSKRGAFVHEDDADEYLEEECDRVLGWLQAIDSYCEKKGFFALCNNVDETRLQKAREDEQRKIQDIQRKRQKK